MVHHPAHLPTKYLLTDSLTDPYLYSLCRPNKPADTEAMEEATTATVTTRTRHSSKVVCRAATLSHNSRRDTDTTRVDTVLNPRLVTVLPNPPDMDRCRKRNPQAMPQLLPPTLTRCRA